MPFPRELTTPPVMKIYLVFKAHLLTGILFYRKMAGSQGGVAFLLSVSTMDVVGWLL
jgi:hypothetical protein